MQTKDETARALADALFHLDGGTTRIFRIIAPDESNDLGSVRLLEVNTMTPAAGILPVGLGADPSRGITYPAVVVEITPEEFDSLMRGELELPHGWHLGDEIFPHTSATGTAS